MKRILCSIMIVFFAFAKANSQVIINELDADTPSTDFEEFIELKTQSPFESLDGYIMVLFNGSGSYTTGMGRSYYVEDLDGLTTDSNGLVVLGSSKVSPAVDRLLMKDGNTFQNGGDAVAIYLGEPSDFPEFTFANQNNLIDALVYGTNDDDATDLLDLLGETVQYNEGSPNNTNSLQLKPDGTYVSKKPTPHSLNDATEPSYIGLDFSINPMGDLNEGDLFSLTFTLTKAAPQNLYVNFDLKNEGFNTADFTGTTSIFIAAGESTQQLDFNITDDIVDEGDESLRVNLGNNLPTGYKRLKDKVEYLVIDNDFKVASYGNPLAPTFGIVESTQPKEYYISLNNLASPELEKAITIIIAETGVVREHTYADITTILKDADASPANSNKVWLLYNEKERRDVKFQNSSISKDKWNREHVFPRSRGGYFDIEEDEIADGIDVWVETSVDSLRHGNSDAHHLRAADSRTNSSRSNKNFGLGSTQYDGPEDSQGSWHGDVARSVFYMTLRYNGLQVVNGDPDPKLGLIGDLETLLEWHRQDPPDDFEMNRNNVIYEWQRNRNPFIDDPELAEFIWGNKAGETYTLSIEDQKNSRIIVFPNPSTDFLQFAHIIDPTDIKIYDAQGKLVLHQILSHDIKIEHKLIAGIYLLQIKTKLGTTVKTIVVN
ncbi:endonuclease [Nonlabens antarcticus]|uniref:endonuclease n=1 Tax=Nonlabens antarcticus TaxID=392714 RepID=UPI0018912156|nr:endonuclease [Nonlabens antarcticus]